MYSGIDPGLSGAIAVVNHDGALVALHDTPVLTLSTSRRTRQEYDVPAWWGQQRRGFTEAGHGCYHR